MNANIVKKSVFISIVLGLLSAVMAVGLLSTFTQVDKYNGTTTMLSGMDAIIASINAFGIASLVRNIIGYFLLFSAPVFLGCLWLGKWLQKSKNL